MTRTIMEISGIAGRVALVTGASGGIGAAIALQLARSRAKIALHYNPGRRRAGVLHLIPDAGETERLLNQLRDAGSKAISVGADLLEPESPPVIFNAIERALGRVDILINNAAHCEEPDAVRFGDCCAIGANQRGSAFSVRR